MNTPKTRSETELLAAYGITLQDGSFLKDGERLTDPYDQCGHAIGNEDDFVCFDFAIVSHPTDPYGWLVLLDSTVNSETGSFIESHGRTVLEIEDFSDSEAKRVAAAAAALCYSAADWCAEAGKPVRYRRSELLRFARHVAYAIASKSVACPYLSAYYSINLKKVISL